MDFTKCKNIWNKVVSSVSKPRSDLYLNFIDDKTCPMISVFEEPITSSTQSESSSDLPNSDLSDPALPTCQDRSEFDICKQTLQLREILGDEVSNDTIYQLILDYNTLEAAISAYFATLSTETITSETTEPPVTEISLE